LRTHTEPVSTRNGNSFRETTVRQTSECLQFDLGAARPADSGGRKGLLRELRRQIRLRQPGVSAGSSQYGQRRGPVMLLRVFLCHTEGTEHDARRHAALG
jgi:hypothetical protein